MALPILPVELLQPIFQLVPHSDLLHLCTGSRLFHDEATCLLYRNVDLHNCDVEQMISWGLQIAENPHLSRNVRELSLPWASCLYSIHRISELRGVLSRAMKALPYLRSLFLRTSTRSDEPATGYLDLHMLLGCEFRLNTFRSEGHFSPEQLTRFLLEQDEIRDWQAGPDVELFMHHKAIDILPHLSVVHINYRLGTSPLALHVIGHRQLTRLRLDLPGHTYHEDAFVALAFLVTCGESLTQFHLHFGQPTAAAEIIHAETLDLIGNIFPNLEFLYYSALLVSYSRPWNWLVFPQALSKFKRLKTIGIDVTNWENTASDRVVHVERFHALAGRFMGACPSLRRVAIAGVADKDQQHIVYVRTTDLHVETGGVDALGESAWRDM